MKLGGYLLAQVLVDHEVANLASTHLLISSSASLTAKPSQTYKEVAAIYAFFPVILVVVFCLFWQFLLTDLGLASPTSA